MWSNLLSLVPLNSCSSPHNNIHQQPAHNIDDSQPQGKYEDMYGILTLSLSLPSEFTYYHASFTTTACMGCPKGYRTSNQGQRKRLVHFATEGTVLQQSYAHYTLDSYKHMAEKMTGHEKIVSDPCRIQ